ncbi:hypothetical protein DFQ30_007229 [Apophysomyces sp. BC1015]|nr:hypothetical protein DFQ30_007229 [Apophysomyces sp. BC1015]
MSSLSNTLQTPLRAATQSAATIHKARHNANRASVNLNEAYMRIVEQPSVTMARSAKQLLILDLNGTLASRTKTRTGMYVRPYQDHFFETIFRDYTVMVWSSAQPSSVQKMSQMFGPYYDRLRLIWDRRHFELTMEEYNNKAVTVKDLEKVWGVLDNFNATNTILLDDSPAKSAKQPFNGIHLRTFDHYDKTFRREGEHELLDVLKYLKELKYQSNVCHYMKNHPYCSHLGYTSDSNTVYYYYSFSHPKRKRSLVKLREKK